MESPNSPEPNPAGESIAAPEGGDPARKFGWGGIGGWLIVPALDLIYNPIHAVMVMITLARLPEDYPVPTGWAVLAGRVVLGNVVIILMYLYAALRFYGKKRNAPLVLIAVMIVALVIRWAPTIVLVHGGLIMASPYIIWCCVWVTYLCVSKRVKRTFVVD